MYEGPDVTPEELAKEKAAIMEKAKQDGYEAMDWAQKQAYFKEKRKRGEELTPEEQEESRRDADGNFPKGPRKPLEGERDVFNDRDRPMLGVGISRNEMNRRMRDDPLMVIMQKELEAKALMKKRREFAGVDLSSEEEGRGRRKKKSKKDRKKGKKKEKKKEKKRDKKRSREGEIKDVGGSKGEEKESDSNRKRGDEKETSTSSSRRQEISESRHRSSSTRRRSRDRHTSRRRSRDRHASRRSYTRRRSQDNRRPQDDRRRSSNKQYSSKQQPSNTLLSKQELQAQLLAMKQNGAKLMKAQAQDQAQAEAKNKAQDLKESKGSSVFQMHAPGFLVKASKDAFEKLK